MTINKFVHDINSALPTSAVLLHKFGPEFDLELFRNERSLFCHLTKEVEFISFSQLLEETNIGNFQIGGFSFHNEIQLKPRQIAEFGILNDFYLFAVDMQKQVISYSISSEEFELVSPTEELFLELLVAYNSYNQAIIFSDDYVLPSYQENIELFYKKGIPKHWLIQFFVKNN